MNSRQPGSRSVALFATGVGAVAGGARDWCIGRWTVRRLVVESAKFKSLEIQDLTVARLRAAEVIVSESLKLPES